MNVLDQKRLQAAERVAQHADEMRRDSKLDGAFVHVCRVVINNRRLSPCESNRLMLESLLNLGEDPSPKLYVMLAEQFPTRFTWDTPQAQLTKEEQRAAFDAFVRTNNLSSCEANFQLFKRGASIDNFADASQIEKEHYAYEAAEVRQRFLIHDATPSELKAEARYQSATERDGAIRAEADRRHQFVSDQQSGLYAPLPAVNGNGEAMDSKYLRRISTVDYNLFKALVKRHGSSQITSRLRGEN
jgi:hypothetical protein